MDVPPPLTSPRPADIAYYGEFPFPLTHLPRPGHAVIDLDVCNVVFPLLEGVTGLLTAPAESKGRSHYASEREEHAALTLLASHVALVLHILHRWAASRDAQQKGA